LLLTRHRRAGQKDTQAPGSMGNQTKAAAKGNRAAEYSIGYSHRGVGPYGPEAVPQVSGSDKWLYEDPVYISPS